MNLLEPTARAGRTAAESETSSRSRTTTRSGFGWTDALDSTRSAFWAHIIVLVGGALAMVWIDRRQWFLTEDWVFFALNRPRLLEGAWADFLFVQYRGHWITTTNVLYETMYRLFGLRSYIPYLLPTILATCACSALVRVHMRRAGVHPWIATGVAALALFLAYGAEDIAKAWQLSFTVAMAFGLGQLWACDHDGSIGRRDALAIGLGFLSLITGGLGVLFAGIVGLSLCLRKRWTAAVVNVAPLALIYVVWYAAYGSEWSDAERVVLRDVDLVFEPVWHALSLSMDGLTRLSGTGGILIVLVAVLAIVTKVPWSRTGTAPVVALAIGMPAFFLFSATSRLASFALLSDRYLHVGELFLLPLIGVVLSRLLIRSRVLLAAGLAVLVVLTVANGLSLRERTSGYVRATEILKPKVMALAALPSIETFPPDAVLSEPLLAFVNAGTVARLRRDGAFPPTTPLTSSEQLAIETDLGIRFTPRDDRAVPPGVRAPATLVLPLGESVRVEEPECVSVDASSGPQPMSLRVTRPTVVPLTTSASGQFVIRVTRSPAPDAGLKLFELEPGDYALRIDLRDVVLELELPDQGVTRFCNVAT